MQRGKIYFFALLWILCSQLELSESQAQSAIRLSHTEATIEAFQHLEELFAAKRFPAARELAQASLHSQPDSPNREQMLAILAESCFQIGDYQAAITAFQQLLSGAGLSLHEQAQLRLGEAQFRNYNLSEAITRFERFRQSYPKSKQLDQCLFWLGECYSQKNDKESAIAAFTQLIKNHPQSAWIEQALYSIGRLYEQSGESDKAFQVYQKLLADFPQRDLARDLIFYLGFASYQAKQYKPAIQFLQQALELYPNHPRAAESQYLIAEANFFTGENEQAVENYQKVINSIPHFHFVNPCLSNSS